MLVPHSGSLVQPQVLLVRQRLPALVVVQLVVLVAVHSVQGAVSGARKLHAGRAGSLQPPAGPSPVQGPQSPVAGTHRGVSPEQSMLLLHCTQRPEVVSHSGVLPEQSLSIVQARQ